MHQYKNVVTSQEKCNVIGNWKFVVILFCFFVYVFEMAILAKCVYVLWKGKGSAYLPPPLNAGSIYIEPVVFT